MRAFCTVAHRWIGLAIAGFLIVAGSTGALLSWEHEIDAWLNPQWFTVDSRGPFKSAADLVALVESSDPAVRVSYLPLDHQAGEAATVFVEPRIDAHGKPFAVGYDQVFVDPVEGRVLGRRDANAVSLAPTHLMPFLYKVHYSLHLPSFGGIDRWGYWLMGGVALLWLVDCFVGGSLTFPPRKRLPPRAEATPRRWFTRWASSWRIRPWSSAYRFNVDLHRAGALWIWVVLFLLAFTSFSLNLYREVFYPLMSMVSTVTPGPFETRPIAPNDRPHEARVSIAEALETARIEAARRGWTQPVGGVFRSSSQGFYSVSFFAPNEDHDSGGMAIRQLYIDGDDGRLIGDHVPWRGSAADVFVQLQYPVHSGRILGFFGRVLMSVMGVAVVVLSVTGIVVWDRKRRARAWAARRPQRVVQGTDARPWSLAIFREK